MIQTCVRLRRIPRISGSGYIFVPQSIPSWSHVTDELVVLPDFYVTAGPSGLDVLVQRELTM